MISLIVARSRNNVIGKDGNMPWHIPEELSQFKALTIGNTVIMGRKTFEAIGHPLKQRTNIIVSATLSLHEKDCFTVHSLKEAIEKYIVYYNEKRIKEKLGWMSPAEYRLSTLAA